MRSAPRGRHAGDASMTALRCQKFQAHPNMPPKHDIGSNRSRLKARCSGTPRGRMRTQHSPGTAPGALAVSALHCPTAQQVLGHPWTVSAAQYKACFNERAQTRTQALAHGNHTTPMGVQCNLQAHAFCLWSATSTRHMRSLQWHAFTTSPPFVPPPPLCPPTLHSLKCLIHLATVQMGASKRPEQWRKPTTGPQRPPMTRTDTHHSPRQHSRPLSFNKAHGCTSE